eukprot:TRINITY_DN7345_c3_g1_i1.p1 TRINITY_DN7345_c3_g1~~TRINITY_DN7345_c3_g1_i1.p1  ORF type:complete len:340 (+),score=91.35 TRINITY_DN7345_c3_g1_i1:52-1071(+)
MPSFISAEVLFHSQGHGRSPAGLRALSSSFEAVPAPAAKLSESPPGPPGTASAGSASEKALGGGALPAGGSGNGVPNASAAKGGTASPGALAAPTVQADQEGGAASGETNPLSKEGGLKLPEKGPRERGPMAEENTLRVNVSRRCLAARPVPKDGVKAKPVFLPPELPLCSRDIPADKCPLAIVDGKLTRGKVELKLSPDGSGCKSPELDLPLQPGESRVKNLRTYTCPQPEEGKGQEEEAEGEGEEEEGGEEEEEEGEEEEVEEASMAALWPLAALSSSASQYPWIPPKATLDYSFLEQRCRLLGNVGIAGDSGVGCGHLDRHHRRRLDLSAEIRGFL